MSDVAPTPSSTNGVEAPALPDLASLMARSSKRSRTLFSSAFTSTTPLPSFVGTSDGLAESTKARLASSIADAYADAATLPPALLAQQGGVGPTRPGAQAGTKRARATGVEDELEGSGPAASYVSDLSARPSASTSSSAPQAGVVALRRAEGFASAADGGGGSSLNTALIRKRDAAARIAKPQHHAQWKLTRVISGHLGWVRCIAVEPGNKWFATGAGDRMIKVSCCC